LLRGRAFAAGANMTAARRELERAVELNDDNAEAHLELGRVLARAHQPRASAQLVAAAQGLLRDHDPRAIDALIEAVQIHPKDAMMWQDIEPTRLAPDDVAALGRLGWKAPTAPVGASDVAGNRLCALSAAEQGDHATAYACFSAAYTAHPQAGWALDA